MNTSQGPDSFEPGGNRGVPRRRWPIVLGLAVLGLLAAAAYVAVMPLAVPHAYTATAAVEVTAPATGGGIVVIPGQVPDLHGQAQVVRSTGVAATAGRMMHSGLSAGALSKQVTVTVPPNSWALDIACAGPSASRAATCANDFAMAYLQSRGSKAANFADAQVHALRQRVTSLSRAKARLRTKVAALPANSPQRAADEAQWTEDHRQLREVAQIAKTMMARFTNRPIGGSILTVATPPGKPSGPNKLPVLLSGLAAGLLLGLIAAFLPGRRDKRIHGARGA